MTKVGTQGVLLRFCLSILTINFSAFLSVLACSIFTAASLPLMAQHSGDAAALPSQFDLFAGYSAWMPNATIQGQHLSNSGSGIILTGAYYLNPMFGLELSSDYHFASGNTSMRSLAIGPIIRHPMAYNFTVFAHALGGAAELVGPPDPIIAGSYYMPRRL